MSKIRLSISSVADIKHGWRFAITALVVAIITLTITGCGYRLSGISGDEQLFSPLLKKMSIEGIPRYDPFRIQLKKDALSYRIKVIAKEYATTRIIIKNKEIKQYAITIGDDAKVREYLLLAKIDFSVAVGDSAHFVESIESETTYTYYPQHVSISLNEKKRALAFLNQDLSAKLIDRLRILINQV